MRQELLVYHDKAIAALRESNLPLDSLELELGKGFRVTDPAATLNLVQRIKRLWVRA